MKRSKFNLVYLLIVIIVLGITLGYAYLNSGLSINGTTNISNASWNVYWDSLNVTNGSVTDVTTAAHILTGETEVEFNVNFTKPGDFYEFTVDAVNDGSIDAMIDSFTKGVYAANGTTPKTLPDYLTYTVTYSDGVEIQSNHLLEAGHTETLKVRVEYKTDIAANQLPSTSDNFMFKVAVNYKQADSNATEVLHPGTFADASWDTIIAVVRAGYGSLYPVGSTKTIDMGTFGTHTLRVANTSTPTECSTTGFSQTACGFVIEFADIIATRVMNTSWTSDGGWPATSMRTYVNGDIYDALPTALKTGIINTTVVSSHGPGDSSNFTSTDKLYLLSTHEVMEDMDGNPSSGISYYDTAYADTRQLDYYKNAGVSNVRTNTSLAYIKQYNNTDTIWWLRSASANNGANYWGMLGNSNLHSIIATYNEYGISPAFRIG